MTVRVYKSTDASAPTLAGAINSSAAVINLLYSCLVTGYGSQAGAGWTRPYTGTNLAAFLQGAGAVNPVYFAIDDTATTASRIRAYETMSAVTTGTGPCPTDAQQSGGAYITRSSTSDVTARPWILVADDRTCILSINVDGTGTLGAITYFGDIVRYKSDDAYHKLVMANPASSYSGSTSADTQSSLAMSVGGHWLLRSYTQVGTSVTAGKHVDYVKSGGLAYPNAVDGGLYLGTIWVHENNVSVVRGEYRGLWYSLHSTARPLNHGDTFSGTGSLAGKTFIAQNVYSNKQMFIETSDTWAT